MTVTKELINIYKTYNPFEFTDDEIREEVKRDPKKFINDFRCALRSDIEEAKESDEKMMVYNLNGIKNRLDKVAERVYKK